MLRQTLNEVYQARCLSCHCAKLERRWAGGTNAGRTCPSGKTHQARLAFRIDRHDTEGALLQKTTALTPLIHTDRRQSSTARTGAMGAVYFSGNHHEVQQAGESISCDVPLEVLITTRVMA
jgi:hypothetical protein